METKKTAENNTNTENFARNNFPPSAPNPQEYTSLQAGINALLSKFTKQDEERATEKKQQEADRAADQKQ